MPTLMKPLKVAVIQNGRITILAAITTPIVNIPPGWIDGDYIGSVPRRMPEGAPILSAGWRLVWREISDKRRPTYQHRDGHVLYPRWLVTLDEFMAASEHQAHNWQQQNESAVAFEAA